MLVAPEHFQAEDGFISAGVPELAAALHATLELAAGGFDGPGPQRFAAAVPLGVFHAVLVGDVVMDGVACVFRVRL